MNRCSLSFSRAVRAPLGLWLALLGAATTGVTCSSTRQHTYVNVHVTIDETISATQLYLVTACEVYVTGPDMAAPFNLPCPENKVPRDVGTFQWVSQAESGTLKFTVSVFDANHVLIGVGTSQEIPVSPGKTPAMTAVVVSLAPGLIPDGGTDTPTTTPGADAGTDLFTASDAPTATDGQTDTATSLDASLDQAATDGGPGDAAPVDQAGTSDRTPTDAGAPDQTETSAATDGLGAETVLSSDGGTDTSSTG